MVTYVLSVVNTERCILYFLLEPLKPGGDDSVHIQLQTCFIDNKFNQYIHKFDMAYVS